MKKVIALLMVMAMVLSLCACGADPDPAESKPKSTTAPSEEPTAPSSEATEPSSEATEPSSEATEPSSEATEPSSEATEPSSEATEPSSEATEPSDEVTEPSDEVTEPSDAPTQKPDSVVTYEGLWINLPGEHTAGSEVDIGLTFVFNGVEYFVGVESADGVGTDAKDSASLAQWVATQFEVDYNVTTGIINGVGYVICENDDGEKMVGGCYVSGDTLWGVCTSGEFEDLDVILDVVTAGVIDENYVPDDDVTEPTVPGDEVTTPTQPSDDTTQTFTLAGLTCTLIGSYEEEYQGNTLVTLTGKKYIVTASFGPMAEYDETIIDSAGFAQSFYDGLEALLGDYIKGLTLGERDGISYIVLPGEEGGQTAVTSFYVRGTVGWTVGVTGLTGDVDVERMIDMATSGVINEDEIPDVNESVVPGEPVDVPFAGLTVTLDEYFYPGYVDESYISYTNDRLYVEMIFESVSLWDETVVDSASFANFFSTSFGEDAPEIKTANGISYFVMELEEINQIAVYSFYVCGGVCWRVCVMSDYPEDQEWLVTIATSGVINEDEIPEIKENVLPDPSEDISFQGLTVHLPGEGTPTMVFDDSLTFEYGGIYFDIGASKQGGLMPVMADGAALAEYLQSQYAMMWDEVTVDVRNGVSYVQCMDEDGYAFIVGCYVSEENWWTVSSQDYFEDVDAIIDLVTAATLD